MPDSFTGSVPPARPLVWLHIGDLHLTDAGAPNHRALMRIVAEANAALAGQVDFALLPGDLAEHGSAAQYALAGKALGRLRLPVEAIPGDHDFHPRSLAAFRAAMPGAVLPRLLDLRGCRCAFLDMVSAGKGGPDFRLGESQLAWLGERLAEADAAGRDSVVFMHTYPADLADPAEKRAVRDLFARHRVRCVDLGHTHYNELANDGRTIYAATRSTGQIEEGPEGFSLMAVDGGGVAWRFKPLDAPWPFTLITAPVDRRLRPDHAAPDGRPDGRPDVAVRALAWSAVPVTACAWRLDQGEWQPMARADGGPLWRGALPAGASYAATVAVRATDASGATDVHTIDLPRQDAGVSARVADGSDADRIGAWPEIGILGTQLGPNRNGRKW